MRSGLVSLALSSLAATSVSAQGPNASPQEVVAAVFAAFDAGDVPALVRLIDPDAMVAFKQRQMEEDSIFAEMASLDTAVRRHPTLLQVMFKVRNREQFQKLTPSEVLTRWFNNVMKGRSRAFLMSPGFRAGTHHVLGSVAESQTVVHVVFRETADSFPMPGNSVAEKAHIRVITTRHTGDGWRVDLNGGLVYEEGGGWTIGYSDENDDSSDVH